MDRPLQQSIAEKAGRVLEDTSNTRSNESLDPSRARLDSDVNSKRAMIAVSAMIASRPATVGKVAPSACGGRGIKTNYVTSNALNCASALQSINRHEVISKAVPL